MTAPRIVSLLPSATEIVAALGFADALVGRSHECDYPEEVADLPVCTEPKVDPRGSSDEIHRSVRELLAQTLSVYRVDASRLRELEPTHLVTQVQCEVCAVSLDEVEEALAAWAPGARPRLTALNPATLADVFADIERVAAALGAPERGRRLVAGLRERMARIAGASAPLPKPRVATIEWLSPLMAAGNWMPELVAMASGDNLFGTAGAHSPWMSWEDLRAADPDVLTVFPCGFPLERVEREIGLLTSLPGFGELSAAAAGRVYLAEANQFFNRPGPRLAETLEILAEILHPGTFAFGHEGSGWKRLRTA